jgi:hypothetical protein
VANEDQLAWEARAGKPAAAASIAAALLPIAAGIYLAVAITSREGDRGLLQSADLEPGDFIVAGALQALSWLLIVPPLLYLFRATRHREPRLMPAAAVLVVLAAIVLAVVTVLRQLELIDIADGFFPPSPEAARDLEQAAEDEIRDNLSATLEAIRYGGLLALAFSVVMISLNAMRAGLLSRFMAIIGIFVGVLLIIPVGGQILQLFWFVALGVLFLGRWPGGRGPAWQTGEAVAWPGAAEQREEIERRRAEREQAEPSADEPDTPRRESRKRKKKRR